MSTRETLDTDDRLAEHDQPTKTKTARNLHELTCRMCGDAYFVDDATYDKVRRALEFDPTDMTFACPNCEDELAEEEHR